ncbi:MAG: lactate racemase domain-containing protein [Promethearchaeota archaeon]
MTGSNRITVPWGAWYGVDGGPEELELEFPDDWDVQVFDIEDAPALEPGDVADAIRNPVGTPPLSELAAGKGDAVVVVEDISRPSYLGDVLEVVLGELESAGIDRGAVTVLGALGAHRPMSRVDLLKKFGRGALGGLNYENHHPYENLVYLGESGAGTPIHVNKTYHDAAVKVAVGTVLPHPLAGFGGGAKIVLPGISGMDTLEGNHRAGLRGLGIGLGFITGLRKDIEDVCARVGLDFSVNLTTSSRRAITGVFAGHFIDAHRKAVEFAGRAYRVELPKLAREDKFDAGIFNLYPEDTELSQAIKGLNLFTNTQRVFKTRAPVVFATASTEGRGFHSLSGETGARLFQNWGDNPVVSGLFRRRPLGIFSPNVNEADVRHFFAPSTPLLSDQRHLVDWIETVVGARPWVAVFPTSLGLAGR